MFTSSISKAIIAIGLTALFVYDGAAFGQTGNLHGYVLDHHLDSLNGVVVRLDYLGSDIGAHYTNVTTNSGQFSFSNLQTGFYAVNADSFTQGFAEDVVEISPRSITYVTLTLSGRIGWNEYTSTLSLRGAVIVQEDPVFHVMHYGLDVGANSSTDYKLIFGPPWYNHGPSSQRPSDGQRVWISGSLFSYSDPPMIIVRSIDNNPWLDSTNHGSAGGAQQHNQGCPVDHYVRVEQWGFVMVREIVPPDSTIYLFSIGNDSLMVQLDFGDDRYHPPNSGAKPTVDGNHDIIGGYYACPESPLSHIVVYEIDGQFWREPGDTSGFGWADLAVPNIVPGVPADPFMVTNYPNPFNATTMITLSVPKAGLTEIEIIDVLGRDIDRLYRGVLPSGIFAFSWNGLGMPSGIYFCRATWKSQHILTRMLLIK
jgi:hypothetical protein